MSSEAKDKILHLFFFYIKNTKTKYIVSLDMPYGAGISGDISIPSTYFATSLLNSERLSLRVTL